jgi:hypothetical protein
VIELVAVNRFNSLVIVLEATPNVPATRLGRRRSLSTNERQRAVAMLQAGQSARRVAGTFRVVIIHFCWHNPFMHKSVLLWEMMTSADANVERKCGQKSSKNKVKTPLINSSANENMFVL